jgi:hypothetical protein
MQCSVSNTHRNRTFVSNFLKGDDMRKVLAVLAATGSLAVGMSAMATSAQADWYGYDWNNWRVGGDYYQPVGYDYGYGYLNNYAPVAAVSTIGMVAPVQTVQTVTVRTIRPSRFSARRQVVTRTTVSQLATAPRALYDYAGPAPAASVAVPTYNNVAYYGGSYSRPLYDYAGPAPAIASPVMASPVVQNVGFYGPAQAVAMPVAAPYYRYTYLWDRTLVIDPATGFVVQTIWR